MSFLDLAAARYSVRKFKDVPVAKEDIDKILQAGHLAPTGCNRQPHRILVIQSSEAMEKLRACTKCHFGAPMAMLISYDETISWKRSKYDGADSGWADASIVTTHMMLEAAEIGVGTTWVMYFDPAAVKEAFDLPETLVPVALLVMGYPAEDAQPMNLHSEFLPMEETIRFI